LTPTCRRHDLERCRELVRRRHRPPCAPPSRMPRSSSEWPQASHVI